MKLSDFDFELPAELIAHAPSAQRDGARLLYVPAQGALQDRNIPDLCDLLQPGDLLVCNDTKVLPARLIGKRGEASVEITLLKPVANGWQAFARRSKRLKVKDQLHFAEDFRAEVLERMDDGRVTLLFDDPANLYPKLERYGLMPLPPYIKRDQQETRAEDNDRYQTVYARKEGAVAAPTAGLHFTDELLDKLKARGVEQCFVTLHVGGGTFLPVKHEDISQHQMHAEWYEITEETAAKINQTRAKGGRIIAVGTTSMRSLESAADATGRVDARQEETDIFITPGYQFRAVDVLFTNFHLPKSTLLMLISAFSGMDRIREAYRHAIEHHYRFFSYGDACLLERGASDG